MRPTFKSGDVIFLRHDPRKICRGDVIVFSSAQEGRFIVHRVTSVNKSGIKTRGDNNRNIDAGFLSADKIIGKVECIERSGKRIRVMSGFLGHAYAYFLRIVFRFNSLLITVLHPAYHWLAKNFILRRIFTTYLKNRIIVFHRPEGRELKLFLGRRAIATFFPHTKRWQIQRPFRLFIDESLLPTFIEE